MVRRLDRGEQNAAGSRDLCRSGSDAVILEALVLQAVRAGCGTPSPLLVQAWDIELA